MAVLSGDSSQDLTLYCLSLSHYIWRNWNQKRKNCSVQPSSRNTRTVPKSQAAEPPTYTSNLGLTSYLVLQLPEDSECQPSLFYSLALILLTFPSSYMSEQPTSSEKAGGWGPGPTPSVTYSHSSQGMKSQSTVVILTPQFSSWCHVHPKWLTYIQEGTHRAGGSDYHLRS